MTENTKEQAPAAADASHEVKQHPSVQDAVQGGPSYFKELEAALSRPDKTPRDWIVIGDAARAHLEAAPVLDELIEARKMARKGEWFCEPSPFGTFVMSTYISEIPVCEAGGVGSHERTAQFIVTAANALQKLIEEKK